MRAIISAAAVAMLMLGSCAQKQEYTDFTITGTIPGLEAGDKVMLIPQGRDMSVRIDTVAGDGTFVIKGVAEQPYVAEISIDHKGDDGVGKSIWLMVENGVITVEAAHVDSLAPSWYTGGEGKMKERNVTIKGGRAQQEYAEYQEFMFPYELAAKVAHKNAYWNHDGSADEKAAEIANLEQANAELEAKDAEFVNAHPTYSISAIKIGQNVARPFKYTDEELTAIANQVAACPDTARVAQINRSIEEARRFTRGSKYSDFEMTKPDGSKEMVSSHFGNGKVKFIDMWASWCGPCRAAIPHVKELYGQYPEGLEIISLSVDQDDDAWKKAMEQEQMPWAQYIAKDGTPELLQENYRLSGIPYLLVINDDGTIAYAGHSPREASEMIASLIK